LSKTKKRGSTRWLEKGKSAIKKRKSVSKGKGGENKVYEKGGRNPGGEHCRGKNRGLFGVTEKSVSSLEGVNSGSGGVGEKEKT